MKKPMPTLVKCVCGGKPKVAFAGWKTEMAVWCMKKGCWCGPIRRSERAAIESWNAVMGWKR